jgi:hypothetical protein
MTPQERRAAERSHRAAYCAQRDLLVRLYMDGVLDYATVALWVLALREELDRHVVAVWEDDRWKAVWPDVPRWHGGGSC